jgi:homoserine kinase
MPARPWVEAFAPATVSNLGPGFDCLGLALQKKGDRVRARRSELPGVQLVHVEGDGGRLSTDPERNTASFAVSRLLEVAGRSAAAKARPIGVELELYKGLPLGSGLGSSGASAVAALVAADAALGLGVSRSTLVECARAAEGLACGAPHADNVAPAIYGGIVLVSSLEPLRIVRLPVPQSMWIAAYTPGCSVATADARAVLPEQVSLAAAVRHAARLGLLIHALHRGDLPLIGEAIVDEIVEPARAGLIPGYLEAKAACCEAGALCCSISGAGPTTFALADDRRRAETLLEILDESFTLAGVAGEGMVDQVGQGARVISDTLH